MAHDFAATTHPAAHHRPLSEGIALPKKLILCCDGTWMNSDSGWVKGKLGEKGHLANPTNVTRIARAISPEDDSQHPQVVYYQAGVGTGIGLYSHLIGGGTGAGLSEHIREAYAFLANNYRGRDKDLPGIDSDSIFLIGFSRGAFTARSIGGLIGAVGVLTKKAMPYFYLIFTDWENAGNQKYKPQFFEKYYELHDEAKGEASDVPTPKPATGFNDIDRYMDQYRARLVALDLTRDAEIKAVAVWDTVGSLGIPVNPLLQRLLPFLPGYVRDYSWFDTGLDKHVKHAFHALALDEHRYPFSPTLWEKRKIWDHSHTKLKQTWFPGAHSNVGGSYDDGGIADITLAWMMDQLTGKTTVAKPAAKDWIKFDPDFIERWLNHELEHDNEWKTRNLGPQYVGWSMGYVYESNYFPQTLLGNRVRTPGQYMRTDYETGKPTNDPLEGTNEFIHASVRARMDLNGRSVEENWKTSVFPHGMSISPWFVYLWRWMTGKTVRPYQPHKKGGPLEHWQLEDGHKLHEHPNMEVIVSPGSQQEIQWRCKQGAKVQSPVIMEDRLGDIEIRLLSRDPKLASSIMLSNNDWQLVKKPQPSPRAAYTL